MIVLFSLYEYNEIQRLESDSQTLNDQMSSFNNQKKLIDDLTDQLILRDEEIIVLEENVEAFKKQIDEVNINNTDSKVSLREGDFKIVLYDSYGESDAYLYKPAYGPLGILNREAIEHTDNITILDSVNDYLTRVTIEGVIPTWFLDDGTSHRTTILKTYRYVINQSDMYLTPSETSIKVNPLLTIGDAVKVIDEYEEWFNVNIVREVDANMIYDGWIKKSSLGYYEALKSDIGIDVLIKKEFVPEGTQSFEHGLWGKIFGETEATYKLMIYGGGVIEIDKNNVEPFLRKQ